MKSPPPDEPLPETEGDAAPRPPEALEELRARARSMESDQEDRDALLNELEREPSPDEDLRARADVLRLIIDDPWLGGFSGSDGRRVDAAAAQALVDLGEPYASELSPEGRAALGLQEGETPTPGAVPERRPVPVRQPEPEERPDNFGMGAVTATVMGIIELVILVLVLTDKPHMEVGVLGLGFIGLVTLAPAYLPRSEGWNGVRLFCTVLMALTALPPLIAAVFAFMFAGPLGMLPLAYGLARLFAVYCLFNAPPERALAEATSDDA